MTDIDNGHSVVVKINDRGPYTRGRILDLSPRAADALDMKRVGVATVVIEPLANQAGPTVAVLQKSRSRLMCQGGGLPLGLFTEHRADLTQSV